MGGGAGVGDGGAGSGARVPAAAPISGRLGLWSDWLASRLIRSSASSSEQVARGEVAAVFKFGAFITGGSGFAGETFETRKTEVAASSLTWRSSPNN